jgi:hypothetical protein
MRIRVRDLCDPGSGMENFGFGIRNSACTEFFYSYAIGSAYHIQLR